MLKSMQRVGLGVLLVMVSALASATEPTAIETVVSAINANMAALLTVGAAILIGLYALRVFSWGRKI